MATVQLKRLCKEPATYGLNIPSEDYVADGVRLLRTSDITDDGRLLPAEHGVFISDGAAEGFLLHTGDVLFSRSGTLGRSLVFDEGKHGRSAHAGYLVRFRPRTDVDPRFVFYFSKSQYFLDQITIGATEATISNFNAQKLASLQLPVYSFYEQQVIADFLDIETARIDGLIQKTSTLLNNLRASWEISDLI